MNTLHTEQKHENMWLFSYDSTEFLACSGVRGDGKEEYSNFHLLVTR